MKRLDSDKNDLIKEGHLGGFMFGGDPATWCPNLWTWISNKFSIRSVIDIGCGQGYAVRYFNELGIKAIGVEGSQEGILSNVSPNDVVQHDFNQNPYTHFQSVDMIWSCEFLEHIDEKYLDNILVTFQNATNVLVLTHAFPGQEGHHHVNCQPTIYWISLLRFVGFKFSLINTLIARYITMKDFHKMNHFGRSGLVFISPKINPNTIPLHQILKVGRNPDFISEIYNLVLNIENIVFRVLRKLGCFN